MLPRETNTAYRITPAVLIVIFIFACSPRTYLINRVGNSFGSAGDIYLTENDPQLVREAFPFNLKAIELLIQQAPDNAGLLTAAASSFTMYGYAFILEDADRLAVEDINTSRKIYDRAKNLLLRGYDYGLRSLDSQIPGIADEFSNDPASAVRQMGEEQIEAMYWSAAALAGSIVASQGNPALLIELPKVGFLLERILEIKPDWNNGAVYSVMLKYELSRPDAKANAEEVAWDYFHKALDLTGGTDCSLYVSAAEAFSIRNQDRDEFVRYLNQALEFDVDSVPERRLSNLLAQDRAKWLLGRIDELFY